MDNVVFVAEAILPVFIVIALGAALRRVRVLDDETVEHLTRLVFTVALPILLFRSVGGADLAEAWNGPAVAAAFGMVLVCVLLGWGLARLQRLAPVRAATFTMCCYRANTAIVGLAVLQSAYPENPAMDAAAGMLIGVSVLVFNVLAVVILTLPHHSFRGREGLRRIARGVATNPLILAVLLGILWSVLKWEMPLVLDRPIEWIARMALPLALLAVGASLRLELLRRGLRETLLAAAVKLLVLPALVLASLRALGVGGLDLAACVVILGSPTAVVSYIMARRMRGDAPLAAQVVTVTTTLSIVTLAGWLLVLRALGAGAS